MGRGIYQLSPQAEGVEVKGGAGMGGHGGGVAQQARPGHGARHHAAEERRLVKFGVISHDVLLGLGEIAVEDGLVRVLDGQPERARGHVGAGGEQNVRLLLHQFLQRAVGILAGGYLIFGDDGDFLPHGALQPPPCHVVVIGPQALFRGGFEREGHFQLPGLPGEERERRLFRGEFLLHGVDGVGVLDGDQLELGLAALHLLADGVQRAVGLEAVDLQIFEKCVAGGDGNPRESGLPIAQPEGLERRVDEVGGGGLAVRMLVLPGFH